MPTIQSQRNLIAKMKLLAVEDLIRGKSLLLIDDSIVRGTQLRETTEYLFESGAKEVHIRPACPPLVYGCKYLNFSRSSSEMDLITRRVIERLENGNVTDEILQEYTNPILKNTSRWLMKSVKNSSSHPCVLTGLTICLIPAELTNANSVLIVGTVRNN